MATIYHFRNFTFHACDLLVLCMLAKANTWYKIGVRSMTGYGRGQSESNGCRVTVEIRSVNHRFLDLKVRGVALDAKHEEALRQCVGQSVSRGALNLSIRVDKALHPGKTRIDHEAAALAHKELQTLRDSLGITEEISLGMVCSQPGVMVPVQVDEEATARVGEGVLQAAEGALQALVTMRTLEGKSLKTDIQGRLQTLAELAQSLESATANTPEQAQIRFEERIARLLKNSKVEVDEARLAQEVAILVDKLDITEELVRLRSHFEQLGELLLQEKPVGRRLDFLVQELGREFNTVTSKSQSANVARLVVEAKAEMEKIREQVQNIE